MTTKTVIMLAAALEVATGIALILSPSLVVSVLFGVDLSGGGIAVGRVGGFALLALATACWPRNDAAVQAIQSLFIFNLLTALYLGYLKVGGAFPSYFLLPACLLHLVLTFLLARPAYQSIRRIASTD
jgi:hypothetical protein